MAGINTLQDPFKRCLLIILFLCPCVFGDFTLCEQNCTCHASPGTPPRSVRASRRCHAYTYVHDEYSELEGHCTCPRFGIVPESILQNVLDLKLVFSELVILTRGTIQKFQQIRSLDIFGLLFVQPGGFQGLETLCTLVLHNDFMHVLETAMFSDLGNLTNLTVVGTTKKILALENGTFVGLTKLEYLDLKGNAITGIAEEHFRDLQNLHTLDLSHNNLSQIKANTFMNSPLLTQLILSNNQITEIDRCAFTGLTQLQKLLLDDNWLKGMPQPILTACTGRPIFGRLPNDFKPSLDLKNNPLRCDCHLNWTSNCVPRTFHFEGSCPNNKSIEIVYQNCRLQSHKCPPNNSAVSISQWKQLNLTCPLAGASWTTPKGRHFQEHGDCDDLFCLTNSDSLVQVWMTFSDISGNYTCRSSDGSQEYIYPVSVKRPSIAMVSGIAAGGLLVVVIMSIVIGCKLRPKPRTVPIDTHHAIDEPQMDQSLEEDDISADGDTDSLLRTDNNIVAANFIGFQKDSLSEKSYILKSNSL